MKLDTYSKLSTNTLVLHRLIGIILHVVGMLKLHTIDKDGTLRRMPGAEI
jgi:cytochrome b561